MGHLFSSFGSIPLFPVTFGAWPSLFRHLYLISPDRANLCLLCKCVFEGKDFVRGGGDVVHVVQSRWTVDIGLDSSMEGHLHFLMHGSRVRFLVQPTGACFIKIFIISGIEKKL